MTAADILALPAGREFDAWIRYYVCGQGKELDVVFNVDSVNCPAYSTDWAAAGPLLEKMAGMGAIFQDGGNKTQPWVIHGVYGDQCVIAVGETAPLAIARAAAILLRKDKT